MATPSDVSVGLAHELAITTTKVGWEPKDFATLVHSEDKAREILAYLRGLSEIKPIHRIDCDAAPFVPDGWSYHEEDQLPSCVKGAFIWDLSKVFLHLSNGQKDDWSIEGNDLLKELESQPVLPANVLDYLFKSENQHLIPEEWKGQAVVFWGTLYRRSDGDLYVRFLYWDGSAWGWRCAWLGGDFDSSLPALLRAS